MSRCSVVLSTQVLQLLRPWHLYGTSLAGTASIRNGPEKWFGTNFMKISGPCHIVVHVLEFFGLGTPAVVCKRLRCAIGLVVWRSVLLVMSTLTQ